MSESALEAGLLAQWRPHPLLGGPQQSGQFSPSWNSDGPRAFLESFLNEGKAPQYTEGTPADTPDPAPALEMAGEPALPAAPDEPLLEEGEAREPLPPLDEAASFEQAEPMPPLPVADEPARQPVATAQTVVDEQMLAREREAGFQAGLAEARAQMRQEIDGEKAAIKELLAAIQSSMADTRQFFAPLQRLAVHLAEQLVRGELTLSGQAIRNLVENCLMEFEHRGEGLVLRLHPLDLEKFSSLHGELSDSVELVGDSSLGRGSVRIEMADGVIEDLIEHRLEALAKSVLGTEPGIPFAHKPEKQRLYRRAVHPGAPEAEAGWADAPGIPPAGALHGDENEGDRVS